MLINPVKRVVAYLTAFLLLLPLKSVQAVILPTLPQVAVDLTMPTQGSSACPTLTTGSNCKRTPASGSATDFQNAINAATCGDTIILAAGSTYSGNFTIPNEGVCSGWIVIQSSALSSLPAVNHRVGTSDASNMAKISTPNVSAAIAIQPFAHNWRFIGIEITTSDVITVGTVFSLANMGFELDDSTAISIRSHLPQNIIIDRCYFHGLSNSNLSQGIVIDALSVGVVDSYCDEVHYNGGDSQCLLGTNDTSPTLIRNNFLQAAGENIMFGGSDPGVVGGIPSDITIVGNVLQKNVAWRGQAAPLNWSVKNHFELKNAQRVLFDGNVLNFTWVASQLESVILRAINQDGSCGQCSAVNITFTHNLINGAPIAMVLTGTDTGNPVTTGTTGIILIQNNVATDISVVDWGSKGWGFQLGPGAPALHDVTIDHNDFFQDVQWMFLGDAGTIPNLQITNNIADYGTAGIVGNAVGSGKIALDTFAVGYIYNDIVFPHAIVSGNGGYPAGTLWSTDLAGIGFTSMTGSDPNIGGNLQLTNGSTYHNAATDGRDIGVWDWANYNNDTANAIAGIWSPLGTTIPPNTKATSGVSIK